MHPFLDALTTTLVLTGVAVAGIVVGIRVWPRWRRGKNLEDL